MNESPNQLTPGDADRMREVIAILMSMRHPNAPKAAAFVAIELAKRTVREAGHA